MRNSEISLRILLPFKEQSCYNSSAEKPHVFKSKTSRRIFNFNDTLESTTSSPAMEGRTAPPTMSVAGLLQLLLMVYGPREISAQIDDVAEQCVTLHLMGSHCFRVDHRWGLQGQEQFGGHHHVSEKRWTTARHLLPVISSLGVFCWDTAGNFSLHRSSGAGTVCGWLCENRSECELSTAHREHGQCLAGHILPQHKKNSTHDGLEHGATQKDARRCARKNRTEKNRQTEQKN